MDNYVDSLWVNLKIAEKQGGQCQCLIFRLKIIIIIFQQDKLKTKLSTPILKIVATTWITGTVNVDKQFFL